MDPGETMRIIHVFNRHRGGGGSDNDTAAIIELLRARGVEQEVLMYDSNDLGSGMGGRVKAFCGSIYSRRAVRRLAALIEDFKPDVVQAYELYPMISPWILPECQRHGVAVVMRCQDYRLSCPIGTHFSKEEICTRCVGGREHWAILKNCRDSLPESTAFALRSAVANHFRLFRDHVERFTAPTDFAAGWLVEHAGLPPERMTTIPCLVKMPEQIVSDPSRGTHVGFAARFVKEKGVDTLVEASRAASLPVVIALPEPAEFPIRESDNIKIIVTANRKELDDFYRGCRIFVMPSLWFESFGLVAAEAMSHGVPVISSRIGALAEVSRDGVTGFLCDPGDAGDLANRLRQMWDDPERCRSMGRAARRHIEQLTCPDSHFERLMSVYREAVGSARRRK